MICEYRMEQMDRAWEASIRNKGKEYGSRISSQVSQGKDEALTEGGGLRQSWVVLGAWWARPPVMPTDTIDGAFTKVWYERFLIIPEPPRKQ